MGGVHCIWESLSICACESLYNARVPIRVDIVQHHYFSLEGRNLVLYYEIRMSFILPTTMQTF